MHVRIITGSKASFFMSLTPWTNGTLISHPDTINLPRAMECFELQGAVWPGEYLFRILCPGPSLGRFDSRPFKIRDITYLRNPIDLGSIAMTPVR